MKKIAKILCVVFVFCISLNSFGSQPLTNDEMRIYEKLYLELSNDGQCIPAWHDYTKLVIKHEHLFNGRPYKTIYNTAKSYAIDEQRRAVFARGANDEVVKDFMKRENLTIDFTDAIDDVHARMQNCIKNAKVNEEMTRIYKSLQNSDLSEKELRKLFFNKLIWSGAFRKSNYNFLESQGPKFIDAYLHPNCDDNFYNFTQDEMDLLLRLYNGRQVFGNKMWDAIEEAYSQECASINAPKRTKAFLANRHREYKMYGVGVVSAVMTRNREAALLENMQQLIAEPNYPTLLEDLQQLIAEQNFPNQKD